MISFGIDPGLGLMGWGVVESIGGEMRSLGCGAISTPAGEPIAVRLVDLWEQLSELIASHSPDVISVERFFFGKSTTTAEMVYHARGVIMLAAARHGVVPYEPKPAEVKLAVCGSGTAHKSQVQNMVCRILGLDAIPRPDDAADALAIAIAGVSRAARDDIERRAFA